MTKITIKDKQFTYTIKRKAISSINLRLISNNSFYISCSHLTPVFSINRFLTSHLDWIYQKSQKIVTYPKLANLTSLSILGQTYLVRFITKNKQSIVFDHQNKFIKIYSTHLTQSNLKKLFTKYFKKLSKQLIEKEIDTIGNFTTKTAIFLRNQKTRFGSCSSRGHLSFNWQIIFFPTDKFRHIICHELVHLSVKNHQKDFYSALSKLDPNYEANNKWLKTDGPKYFLIRP